jgi:hypothetical protein
MKKRFMLLFGFLVLLLVPVLSQDPEIPGILVIPDVNYLVANFGFLMLTATGVAAIASFLGEGIIRLLKMTGKVGKIVVVMVLAVALSFIGGLVNIGYLAEAPWWQTGIWGLFSGVVAAGLRGTNMLFFKSIVEFVIGLILKKEPTE